jgi:uncharacterized protein
VTGKSTYEKLDALLESLPEDGEHMMLEELDGFLAGVLASPDMIMPGQWLPHIWSHGGKPEMTPDFGSMEEYNRVLQLIMDHYNSIATSLLPGHKTGYEPILMFNEETGDAYCFMWLLGFHRALATWPESWLKIMNSTDPEAKHALANLQRLVSIVKGSKGLTKKQIDELAEAPDHLGEWIETLAWWRMQQSPIAPVSAHQAFKHTGRNDLCPCGSGRKYKKCHGAN